MAGFLCLFFVPECRQASTAFLIGWAVYLSLYLNIDIAYYYYALSATIEFCIAIYLLNRYSLLAYIGFFLVSVNVYGLFLYMLHVSPLSYDVIYAIASILQFILLASRSAQHGVIRLCVKRVMVFAFNFDGGESCGIIQKETNPQRKNK